MNSATAQFQAHPQPTVAKIDQQADLSLLTETFKNLQISFQRNAVAAQSNSSAARKKRADAIRAKRSTFAFSGKPKKPIVAASLVSLPIWIAAEILQLLDLASVLALTEVSKSVRAVFRTPASAAVLMPLALASPCANHRVDLAASDANAADHAWGQLKWAFQFAWTHESSNEACVDCASAAPCVKAANMRSRFTLAKLHKGRCCKVMAHLTSRERRIALRKALASVQESLRADSSLCNGFISGSLRDRSLHEVAAVMKCTRYLFSISHIVYSHNHDQLNAAMRKVKFAENVGWSMAADIAIEQGHWDEDEYDDDEFDNRYGGGGGECWNCGEYGHYARDC